jgi:hypothetical protein
MAMGDNRPIRRKRLARPFQGAGPEQNAARKADETAPWGTNSVLTADFRHLTERRAINTQ